MTQEDEKLLEEAGWVVECESPFELWHEASESRATNQAAIIVLEEVKRDAYNEMAGA